MIDFKLYRIAKIGTQEITHGGECDWHNGYIRSITSSHISVTESGELFRSKEYALKGVNVCNDRESDPDVRYELETINCEIEDEE